ncbi:MAG: flagellar assembly peptidoglycan hydrolase FlgJ [Pseudomonadales bacterium]
MNSSSLLHSQMGADAYTDLASVNAIRSLGRENKNQALEKIAQQFESMMVRMMMKSMRSANEVFAEGNYLSSNEGDMYQGMYDDQLALSLSQGKGMGIADIMVRQLKSRFGDPENAEKENAKNAITDISSYLENRNNYSGPVPGAVTSMDKSDQQPKAVIEFDGSVQKFVDHLYPMAQKAAKVLGVEPEVLIAQSALETGWGVKINGKTNGESSLNFFNIKADKRWQGDWVTIPTLEFRQGIPVKEFSAFRAYQSPQHSFEDYAEFISQSPRYEKALHSATPEAYIRHIGEAGYATDPHYADKVIQILNSETMRNAVKSAAAQSAVEA